MHIQTYKDSKKMEISIRSKVSNLNVGESFTISVDEVSSSTLRNYATELGFHQNKTFSVHKDRQNRTYTISRVS